MDQLEDLCQEKKIDLYYKMLLSRYFEEKVNEMFMKGMIHGTTHLGIGQEANHAGVSGALEKEDWLLTTHRGHGHFIGRGGSAHAMMAELFGLREGACHGLGGSMHLADTAHYNMGSSGVVGGGVPLSVGMAFALKYQKKPNLVLSIFGDGASNQGMTLESLNLASVWEVPVLFYCENNGYGMSAPAEKFVGGQDIPARARAFGIDSVCIDGNDLIEVYNTVKKVGEYVRTEKKPFLIEAKTYRWLGHSKSDLRKYRTKEEEDAWKEKCPIKRFRAYLLETGMRAEELEALEERVRQEIEDSVSWCMQHREEILTMDEALTYVYYDGGESWR